MDLELLIHKNSAVVIGQWHWPLLYIAMQVACISSKCNIVLVRCQPSITGSFLRGSRPTTHHHKTSGPSPHAPGGGSQRTVSICVHLAIHEMSREACRLELTLCNPFASCSPYTPVILSLFYISVLACQPNQLSLDVSFVMLPDSRHR